MTTILPYSFTPIHLPPYSFGKLLEGNPFTVSVARAHLFAVTEALGSGAAVTFAHGALQCQARVTAVSNHTGLPLSITVIRTSKPETIEESPVYYKIKGTGDRRTVHDHAGVLIGRLVKHEKEVINTTAHYRNGHPVSATISKGVDVWWRAHDADGNRLGRVPRDLHGEPMGAWKGASHTTLKAWRDPQAWEGLVTTGARADAEVAHGGT